jgi:hypothetical protein
MPKKKKEKILAGGRTLEFYKEQGAKGTIKREENRRLRNYSNSEDNYTGPLPHLHGFKFYKWAREFFESTNKMNLLTAANQCGKSITNIRKCIHWATEKTLWPKLWPKGRPYAFYYLYPDRPTFEVEYNSKWKPRLLPKNKKDPTYGWEEVLDRGKVIGIKFNSDVIVWFKMYSQKVTAMQAATLHAVFTDEELPVKYFPELKARLNDTDGYFHSAFTATLNQEMWRQAMEPGRGDKETFPDALKLTVSLYDCMLFEDGSPGRYTDEKIKEIIKNCGSQVEIDRRVYGKFVNEVGIRYSSFDADRHFIPPFKIPDDYFIYAGVDMGSGGHNHPASISFLAVHPDGGKGYIFKGWRGDGIGDTTAGDVMDKFLQLKGSLKPVMQVYDHASREFAIIAQRLNEPFSHAEKSRELGTQTINTLFKNDMLFIFDDDPELQKLGSEFMNLRWDTHKSKAKDDFIDSARFAIVKVQWDWSKIVGDEIKKIGQDLPTVPDKPLTKDELLAEEIRLRRSAFDPPKGTDWGDLEEDLSFWNQFAGNE